MSSRPIPWWEQAACRGMDSSIFFPERGESLRRARAICASCSVGTECEEYANQTQSEYGMWNGVYRSRGGYKQADNIPADIPVVIFEPDEPKENPMIPKSLSASSLQVYLECPARWKAEYMDRARTEGGSAADLGTACHEAIEVWVKDDHYLRDGSLTTQVMTMKALYDEAYWRLFADGSRYDEGFNLVKGWLTRQDWSNKKVVSTEEYKTFFIPVNLPDGSILQIPFNYIRDRLDIMSDGTPRVIDYKSISMPVQPDELKGKVQVRAYALATQLEYPDAEKIWVAFDLLRYDEVGVLFTKEENRATWVWLQNMAQRIINDAYDTDTDPDADAKHERLNASCRWCVRKSVCKALNSHAGAGGNLGITNPEVAAKMYHDLTAAKGGIEVQLRELEKMLLKYMELEDSISQTEGDFNVAVTVSSRRDIDDGRARQIVGDTVMAKYGKMSIGNVDLLMKSDELTDEQKTMLKGIVTRNFGDPKIKVNPVSPF